MSGLRLSCDMLQACSRAHQNLRTFSTTLACQKKSTNRFLMEHNKRPETEKDRAKDWVCDYGYPTGQARRNPYKRPVILNWETYDEIPYHFREGNQKKKDLLPQMKKIKIKKYKNIWEERPHYRSAFQRLTNKGKGLIPYDKKMSVITGKHTGPGVEGGTDYAQKLAALHLVQPTGYIDKIGNFRPVKEMVPEFVVPKLKGFKLKAYVPYRTVQINQSKFTARSLYNAFYAEEAKQRFEEETGEKPELGPQQPSLTGRLKSVLPFGKKDS